MRACLSPGAQMLFSHKWSSLDTLLFSFNELATRVASLFGMIFFHLWSGFGLNIPFAVKRKRLQMESKIYLTTIGFISEFCG